MLKKAFGPSGPTTTLAVTTTSARVALPSRNVRIHNSGSSSVFVRFGDSTITAATANAMPLPAGSVEVFHLAEAGQTHIAGIMASGTATLHITPGEGI